MKYNDAQEFLAALDETLQKRAEQIGRNQDYQKLKEELAIERFLARINPEIAVVKGGAAAMLTVSNAPHTNDVDLVITESVVQSLGLRQMNPAKRTEVLAELIQDQLRVKKGDFFRFKFEDAFPITDLKPGHACSRINITVAVGNSEMHFLQVDIALQDGALPTALVEGRDMLGFADVANPQVRTVTPEFLFADKTTLYLEEHGRPGANRVKDIVHAALIAENCNLSLDELTKVLADRATHRSVVGKLSAAIPDPPDDWNDRFEELIEQAQSRMTIQQAMRLIRETVDKVVCKAAALASEQSSERHCEQDPSESRYSIGG
ncbi:MAG TPA: nucleotidyl transferase AbiEii/AbiGii toxin family protein [Planktothrix sp.]|jgi:hypothetical protein